MTKGWKIGAVVAAVLVIAAGLFVIDRRSRKENTSEAPAQVVSVQSTSTGSGTNRRKLRVRYRYQLAGALKEGTKIVSATENWSTQSQVKVCYNPSNPRHHRLERLSFRCGS